MFLLRSVRKNTCELSAISKYFLTLPKTRYSSAKCDVYLSKLSSCLSSRFHHNFSEIQFRYCSTKSIDGNETSEFSDDEISSSASCSSYTEHPNIAKYSDEDIKHYRKNNNITVKGDNIPRPIMHFNELPVSENLKEVLEGENYPEPTPIQSQGWPVAFSGRDMVGVSQTGSGKTLAYMLPAAFHAANTPSNEQEKTGMFRIPSPKVLVLGPTRELVQQILQVSKKYIQASHLRGACVYGGASRGPQLNQLRGAEICIATPGRLLDYLTNRETTLKNCSYLVLDEADRMLDMGFEPQIRDIIDHIPNDRQTLMWSATWPKEIKNLAEDFLRNYIHITVGDVDLVANPNIQQNVYVVDEEEKFEKFYSLMTDILNKESSKILVFAETKRKVNFLTHVLNEKGLVAWGIHGDCTQNQRDRILRDFRKKSSSVLIATDIASRGLDVTDIHHVFNYDFPNNIEDYIHRIGRTARGSASGKSHSFFTPENIGVLKDLLSVLKKTKQEINPELYNLIETVPSKSLYPQNRYNYHSSYGKNRMSFGKSRTSYGNNRMPYGNNRMSYGRSGYNNDRDNSKYGKEKMDYVIA